MVEPYIVDDVVHPVGNDWAAVVKINQAGTDPAVPVNLTGWTFWVTITKDKTWDDSDAYAHKSFTAQAPTLGEVTLSIPADELTIPGMYYRDIKVKSSSGFRTTLVTGTFDLVAVPTKAL